jgi:hypothetical protein
MHFTSHTYLGSTKVSTINPKIKDNIHYDRKNTTLLGP